MAKGYCRGDGVVVNDHKIVARPVYLGCAAGKSGLPLGALGAEAASLFIARVAGLIDCALGCVRRMHDVKIRTEIYKKAEGTTSPRGGAHNIL
jgi:hypothetical protein